MKKFVLGFLLFFAFLVKVEAVDIRGFKVSGSSEVKIGEEGTIHIDIQFAGLKKGLDNTEGIWMIAYGLVYDEDVIKITDINTPNFNSVLAYDKEDKMYVVLSEVAEYQSGNDYCALGELYCSDYSADIKYIVKNTTKTNSSITAVGVVVYLLDMNEDREYTSEDAETIILEDSKKHTVSIPQRKNTPTSSSNKKTNTNISSSKTETKSGNKFLKSLEIENVDIDFDRQNTDYIVYVEKGTNKLNVKASVEDKNATYKIIGADDLNANQNIVRVEVTAQDKTKQTYYIRVKYKKNEQNQINDIMKEDVTSKKKVDSKKNEKKTNNAILKWIGIGAGVFFVIGLIAFIISKVKDRSIDKKLESLDD